MRTWIASLVVLVGTMPLLADEKKKEPTLYERVEAAKLADKPFTLFVMIKIKEGTKEKFEAQAKITAAASLKEKGCQAYELHEDAEHPGTYILFEKWASLTAIKVHMDEQYTKDILKLFGEVAAAPLEVKLFQPSPK